MKYVEIHCHTTHSNSKTTECLTTPLQLVKEAKKKGLSAIAITDHDTMSGYHAAKKYAKRHGITLIPAMEIDGNQRGQILAYGIKTAIKPGKSPIELIKEVHAQGGIAIIPHPFDVERRMENVHEVIKHADGLEGRNYGAVNNWKARRFAKAKNVKVVTGGSDAHHRSLIGTVVLGFDDSCVTVKDYLTAMKNGEFQVVTTRGYLEALSIGIMNIFYTRSVGFLWNVFPSKRLAIEIDGVYYLVKVVVRAPFKLSFTATKTIYKLPEKSVRWAARHI